MMRYFCYLPISFLDLIINHVILYFGGKKSVFNSFIETFVNAELRLNKID